MVSAFAFGFCLANAFNAFSDGDTNIGFLLLVLAVVNIPFMFI